VSDVFSRAKRSEIMGRVKSRGNRNTELRLISIFHDYKITGWRRRAKVFGSPDFVFRCARLAVFVDGCFWHCCPVHGSIPVTNREFWAAKLERNRLRDQIVAEMLAAKGWRVLRIWQHELRDPQQVNCKVRRALTRPLGMAVSAETGRR
jgi:DNA mismatch endonuclease, patch repair protein